MVQLYFFKEMNVQKQHSEFAGTQKDLTFSFSSSFSTLI